MNIIRDMFEHLGCTFLWHHMKTKKTLLSEAAEKDILISKAELLTK